MERHKEGVERIVLSVRRKGHRGMASKVALKLNPFDPTSYLKSTKDRAVYMDEALTTGDPLFVADAEQVIARAEARIQIKMSPGTTK